MALRCGRRRWIRTRQQTDFVAYAWGSLNPCPIRSRLCDAETRMLHHISANQVYYGTPNITRTLTAFQEPLKGTILRSLRSVIARTWSFHSAIAARTWRSYLALL